MKKMLVLMMVCLLVGCNIESKFNGDSQVYASDERLDLSEVVPSETTYDELLEMFGPADRYYYGERVLDVNDLPKAFYMRYDEAVTFWMRNNKIIEMRIESDSVTYGDVYCGQRLEEALTYLNEPEEVLDGYHLYEKENVLYKNIKNQFDGEVAYYHDALNQIRIWSHDDVVSAIYYIGDESLHYDSMIDKDPIGFGYSNSNYLPFMIAVGYEEDEEFNVINPFIITKSFRTTETEEDQMLVKSYQYMSDNSTIRTKEGNIALVDIIKYENDPYLKGKWLFKDFVYELDEFDVSTRRSTLNFIDLEVKRGGSISSSVLTWTKGWIINTRDFYNDIYQTSYQTLNGTEYLVLEPLFESNNNGYFIFEKDTAK